MLRITRRKLSIAIALTAITASAVFAGPPWISIEYPVNPFDPAARSGFVTVRTYHHGDLVSFDISGTAEGLVGGQRVSTPLDIKPLRTAGTYVVNWKKPASGNWILFISTTRDGEHMATAVVRVDQAGRVAEVSVPSKPIENGRWIVPRAVAAAERDALLRNSTSLASLTK